MLNRLAELAMTRSVFHFEADLQHALAWHLHEHDPSTNVRLEYRTSMNGSDGYIDILLRSSKSSTGIELKYKTNETTITQNGETFSLRKQGAHDQARYDFIKDISRLESFVKQNDGDCGYAVFITNDVGYWNPPRRPDTVDRDFRMHDGRVLSGVLSWQGDFKDGTVAGRTAPIELKHEYTLQWNDFADIPDVKRGLFKSLVVRIGHNVG